MNRTRALSQQELLVELKRLLYSSRESPLAQVGFGLAFTHPKIFSKEPSPSTGNFNKGAFSFIPTKSSK